MCLFQSICTWNKQPLLYMSYLKHGAATFCALWPLGICGSPGNSQSPYDAESIIHITILLKYIFETETNSKQNLREDRMWQWWDSPHRLLLSAGRAGRGPWCQLRLLWARCPPAPLQTSACPVEWVRCMMRTRLFALKTALDSLQGFLPSSVTRYKSHKSCVELKASLRMMLPS